MSSKDSLGRARRLLKQYCTESDDHDCPQSECRKCEEMAEDIAAEFDAVRLDEALEMRAQYHHLEEWERQLKFVQYMDKRVAELEGQQ